MKTENKKATHTPGPLKHDGDQIINSHGYPVAKLYDGKGGGGTQADRNKYGDLFVVAPEMLDALKAVVEAFPYCMAEYAKTDAIKKAKAIIAKAEGGI